MTTSPHPTITAALCKFISTELVAPGVTVTSTTSLEQLGIDSFSIIEIILFIERQYGVTLPDEALTKENIYSVETIVTCVLKYYKK